MTTDPIIPLQLKTFPVETPEFLAARKRADKILDTTTYRIFKARQYLNYNRYNHHKTIRNLLSIIIPLTEELNHLADVLEQHDPPHP